LPGGREPFVALKLNFKQREKSFLYPLSAMACYWRYWQQRRKLSQMLDKAAESLIFNISYRQVAGHHRCWVDAFG
jgi:hypothetical protein